LKAYRVTGFLNQAEASLIIYLFIYLFIFSFFPNNPNKKSLLSVYRKGREALDKELRKNLKT
jgi:hypothetical protein